MDSIPSRPVSSNSENRRARRKRERTKESQNVTPEAGPSTNKIRLKSPEPVSEYLPNRRNGRKLNRPTSKNFGADDFIPFVDSDEPSSSSEEEMDRSRRRDKGTYRIREDEDRDSEYGRRARDNGKGKARDNTTHKREDISGHNRNQTPPPSREWDRGKVRERSRDNDRNDYRGKRKHDMIFDFDDGYANKKQRIDSLSRKAPWIADVDWEGCSDVAEMLHREVNAFVKWISPTPVEDEVRGLIISQVSQAIKSAFPDAEVLAFGSYETKLYLPLGDIDLVIQSESMAYNNKVDVLHALANTIKRAGITSTKVTIIAKAKVPIVKFITTHGRFSVDISINQSNGVVSGKIINGFLENMDGGGVALRSLVMITKAFLSQRSMNEVFTGGLGSYSIVCLAVSFLQMHPKIRRGEIDADKNLGVLVMEFFELYGCYFNYDEVGISVRDGGRYFSKKQRGWNDYYKNNLLSIEDPADPSNDISRGSYAFGKVRATLAGAHGILTAAAYLRAGMINSQKEGRTSRFRSHGSSEDMSILSSVMGITQETINHRRLVQELYDNRTLHRLVGIQPKAIVVAAKHYDEVEQVKPSSSRSGAARSVVSAWETSDIEQSGDDTLNPPRSGEKHNDRDEDDEVGRYDIRHPPPKKRRKVGIQREARMFTTDDEDDDDLVVYSFADSVDDDRDAKETGLLEAEEAYGNESAPLKSHAQNSNVDKKRSYWLSKGIGIGGDDYDSD